MSGHGRGSSHSEKIIKKMDVGQLRTLTSSIEADLTAAVRPYGLAVRANVATRNNSYYNAYETSDPSKKTQIHSSVHHGYDMPSSSATSMHTRDNVTNQLEAIYARERHGTVTFEAGPAKGFRAFSRGSAGAALTDATAYFFNKHSSELYPPGSLRGGDEQKYIAVIVAEFQIIDFKNNNILSEIQLVISLDNLSKIPTIEDILNMKVTQFIDDKSFEKIIKDIIVTSENYKNVVDYIIMCLTFMFTNVIIFLKNGDKLFISETPEIIKSAVLSKIDYDKMSKEELYSKYAKYKAKYLKEVSGK